MSLMSTALAQTVPQKDGIDVLSGFLNLPRSTYQQALQVTVGFNASPSKERLDQAVYDAALFDYAGFGTKINALMLRAFNDPASPGYGVVRFVDSMGSTRVGNDTTWLRIYYGQINTYGSVFGLTTPGVPNPQGNPRPYQVNDQIHLDPRYGAGTYNSGSYPSGHAMNANVQTLLYAVMAPELYQPLLARSAESQNSRLILGVHYALDVIAGRILATEEVVHLLNNTPGYLQPGEDFAKRVSDGAVALHAFIQAQCGVSLLDCANANPSAYSDKARNKAAYTASLTYGLAPVGRTDLPPVVPEGAEVLLATRFPYLTAAQRRDVLATTEIASGQPLDTGTGWARLNLFAAADGYGAFNGPVTITMDAAKGGFSALDSFGNDIGGAGSLTKAGTGTLVLTGTNSYAGGTTVAGGTLVGHAQAFGSGPITDNANLVLDQATDASMANAIGGTGTLTKINAGTLALTGTSSLSGPTTVLGGMLRVNGSLANSVVTVGPGAILGGSGTVGGIQALGGAIVAPGNSIGTLTATGPVAFAPGSTVRIEANAAGQSDRIVAADTASLAGGTVQVLAAQGTYAPRTLYPILTARGGVQGQFAGVTSNFAFLTPTLRYNPGEVDLILTRNDLPFASVARNRNQAAAATAIQAGGPDRPAYTRTIGLSADEAATAFGALSGDVHASTVSAAYETAAFLRETVLDRLRNAAPAARDFGTLAASYTADLPGRPAAVTPVPMRILDPQAFGLWGQGFGSFGRTRTDGNAASLGRDRAGLAFGADMRGENGLTFGVAAGYISTSLDTAGQRVSGTIEGGFGSVYGGYAAGPFALRVGAAYAADGLNLRRTVAVPGFTETEAARYGGSTIQGFGELGYRIALGALPPVFNAPISAALEPFVGGAYVDIARDRFAETGGSAALTGAARNAGIPTLTAGLRGEASLDQASESPLLLHGLIGYRRAFGDVIPAARVAFATGPGFVTAGLPIARDALVASAGVDLQVSTATSLGISYTGQIGTASQDHAVKGAFLYRF
jgi:autotransporter-associated beta strand protein